MMQRKVRQRSRRAGACLLVLAYLSGFSNPASSQAPNNAFEICQKFHDLLSRSEKIEIAFETKSFEYLGNTHRGCEVRFEFDVANSGEIGIDRILYPIPGSPLALEGWRAEREADGPGASAFEISRGKFFCHIEWAFPAYFDERQKEYVTGDRTTGQVRCAVRA